MEHRLRLFGGHQKGKRRGQVGSKLIRDLEVGATDYISKSMIRVELEPKVRSALAMKQASGQHPSLKDREAAPAGPRTRT